jgi:tetratricopeptide (TPR) repeat protein
MDLRGKTIGIVGALTAFPRRLAARGVEAHGGVLRHGATRRTSHVVFGRRLLSRYGAEQIEAKYDAIVAGGRTPVSELGLLRWLGLAETPEAAAIPEQSLREQSGLSGRDIALLSLFDAFEHYCEPYSFRDVILARKYAGLIAGGANWYAIVRSVHNAETVSSLTAVSLQLGRSTEIYARRGEVLSELDGQALLALDEPAEDDADLLFEAAEDAEQAGEFEIAAALYRRCLAADPRDSVAAFNLANCLRSAEKPAEAQHAYAVAIKTDPSFVEAWFNAAGLLKDRDELASARQHLERAIRIDPEYADAVYNLAVLEYEMGDLDAAREHWKRYLDFDTSSDWARLAMRGIQFIDLDRSRRKSGTHE